MLNYQKSIIFCVLLAVVWVQLSRAELSSKDDEKIKKMEKSLIHAKVKNLIPKHGTNHFISWKSWSKISDATKLKIASNYETELNKAKPGIFGLTKNRLAELAYKALDKYVNEELKDIKDRFTGDPDTVVAFKNVVKQGQFLDYEEFVGMQELAGKLMKTVTCEVKRNFETILPAYLSYRVERMSLKYY